MRHVDLAFDAIGLRPEMTVLLGITPHAVESGYGWVERGELMADTGLFRVRRFWEKPGSELAAELLRAGCLWNSFVMVARVSTLIGLIMVAMPALYASFSKIRDLLGTAREPGFLERLYERIPTASLSNEVLERYPINLSVYRFTASNGASSANLSGSWLFCPTWEFIPNGKLPSRCQIRDWAMP